MQQSRGAKVLDFWLETAKEGLRGSEILRDDREHGGLPESGILIFGAALQAAHCGSDPKQHTNGIDICTVK